MRPPQIGPTNLAAELVVWASPFARGINFGGVEAFIKMVIAVKEVTLAATEESQFRNCAMVKSTMPGFLTEVPDSGKQDHTRHDGDIGGRMQEVAKQREQGIAR